MNYNFELVCPNCNNDNIVEDRSEGNYLCRKCGLVVDTIIATGPERYQDFMDLSYGTPGAVSTLNISNNSDFFSSEKHLYEVYDDKDPSMDLAIRTIKYICTILSMSKDVLETSLAQLDKVKEGMRSFKGYNMEEIAAAVVYISVGLCHKSHSLAKISKASDVEKNRIESMYFKISKYTDKKENPEKQYSEMCNSICSKLGLSKEENQKAEKVLRTIVDNQLLSGKPTTSIGVAIYGAIKEKTEENSEMLEKIGKELGRTTYSIKENYSKIQHKITKVF